MYRWITLAGVLLVTGSAVALLLVGNEPELEEVVVEVSTSAAPGLGAVIAETSTAQAGLGAVTPEISTVSAGLGTVTPEVSTASAGLAAVVVEVFTPLGACCDSLTGGCTEVEEDACMGSGGNFQGNGTRCTTNPCPPPCDPDADGDGIQDDVDVLPGTFSNSFVDTSTTPTTRGGYAQRGDQNLCTSDAPLPDGLRVESLSGGSMPAIVQVLCFSPGFDMDVGNLNAGECITATCRPGPVAELRNGCSTTSSSGSSADADVQTAAVGDVDVSFLANGLVVGTLVLPEGNTITYDPQALTVTAPASNGTTLTVVTPSGDQLPLPPGVEVTLLGSIPAATTWGLMALALALLVGARVYFGRLRVARAAV